MIDFNVNLFEDDEVHILKPIVEMLEPIFSIVKVSHRLGLLRIEAESDNDGTFVLQIGVHRNIASVNLTNILIPFRSRAKISGRKIVTSILKSSNELKYDLLITEITNENWFERLINNGAIAQDDETIYVDPNTWNYN